MYFKEKEDTNIDSEFDKGKKFSLKNLNKKTLLFVGGGILLLLIIIIIITIVISNSSSNYTLELLGDEEITIMLGDDYFEPGYKALDKDGNDVSTEVEITSNVDYSKPGTYEILYSIDGINVVRYIKILDKKQDTYIYLLGEQTITLKVGQKYEEPGYIVYDILDSDIKNKVVITGSVDTSKKGIYIITYTVTNSRNVTVSATRKVVVE